jgi:hypothetical protein
MACLFGKSQSLQCDGSCINIQYAAYFNEKENVQKVPVTGLEKYRLTQIQ